MSGPTKQRKPVVTRRFRADETACAEAVRLLLDHAKEKGSPPDKGDPDDATKGIKDGRAKSSISA